MRGRGGFIGANVTPASAAINSAASGVWNLREAESLKRAGTWPNAPLFGFIPTSIAGCAIWLDGSDATTVFDATSGGNVVSNNGSVARWQDKSGNSRHALQSNSGQRPVYLSSTVNGLGALDFNGSSQWIKSTSVFSGLTDFSYFVVVKNDDAGANTRMVFGERVNLNDGGILLSKNGNTSISYGRGCVSGSVRAGVGESVPFPTSPVLLSMVTTSSSGTARRNAQNVGTDNTTTAAVSFRDTFTLGNTSADNADVSIFWWDGRICEVLVYNSALSDTNRAAVETHLLTKWGIT